MNKYLEAVSKPDQPFPLEGVPILSTVYIIDYLFEALK